jgi:hypothetical protein
VSELDAIPFGACQECHGITVRQSHLREVESDDTAFLERGAKDSQVFPGNPATDAKNDTLFEQHPVDPACHGHVDCCPDALFGKPNASRDRLKVQQKPDVDSMVAGRFG